MSLIPLQRHPLGMRVIILYKLVKGPLMLALALWLTLDRGAVNRSLEALVRDLAVAGAAWARVGAWLQANLTSGVMTGGAVLAWLDGLSTTIEGFLLLSGKSWAEWVVIVAVASLLPIEIVSLEVRPGPAKWFVLVINALIVAYLVWRRLDPKRGPSVRH